MKEYIITIGGVMLLTSLASMLMPEGTMKKFASLSWGFMIICAVLSPVKINFPQIDFSKYHENVQNEANEDYRAKVLLKHKSNLEKAIESRMKGGKAYVETDNEGNITFITLRSSYDESRALMYITENLNVERERIKTIYENN